MKILKVFQHKRSYIWGAVTMRSKEALAIPSEVEELSVSADARPKVEDRASRLARLKLTIDRGTYKVSAQDVAEKVVRQLREKSAKPY